jgi:hypothetical protein
VSDGCCEGSFDKEGAWLGTSDGYGDKDGFVDREGAWLGFGDDDGFVDRDGNSEIEGRLLGGSDASVGSREPEGIWLGSPDGSDDTLGVSLGCRDTEGAWLGISVGCKDKDGFKDKVGRSEREG